MTRGVFRVFGALAPLLKGIGRAVAMRRSELYQKVSSNRPFKMDERWYEGKSVRAGTHFMADFTIYN